MGVLASDSDSDWREYERTGKFLIFIWRTIYENTIRLRLPRLRSRRQSAKPINHGFRARARRHFYGVLSG